MSRSAIVTDGVVVNVIAGSLPGSVVCGNEVIKGWLYDGSDFTPPIITPTKDDVNQERNRRTYLPKDVSLTTGKAFTVDIKFGGRENIANLDSLAKTKKELGNTDLVAFTDADNFDQLLTNDEVIEMAMLVMLAGADIHAKARVLKNMETIPQNYADDTHWT